jgi:amidase
MTVSLISYIRNNKSKMIKNRIHAFNNDDVLGNFDTVDLVNLLKSGKISSKEVIEATIKRAEKVNPTLKAISYKNFTNALQDVNKKSDGHFNGIPLFIKDMTNVIGIPTNYGSEAFKGAKPSKIDDPIIKKIKSMGFINMGMSTMPEMGFTCSTEFPNLQNTVNPWNPEYSAGGSSGGAVALVAAGVVTIAHSADGGGSTRIPASCNGLVGLKPTRGRLLKSKAFEIQPVEIAIDGVETRSVRDTAHFYFEAEKYYHNKKLQKIGLVTEPTKRKLNIGFVDGPAHGKPLDTATKNALDQTVVLLQDLGHQLIPVKFPITEQMSDDFKMIWAANAYFVQNFGKLMFPAPFEPKNLSKLTNGLTKLYSKRILESPFIIYRLNKSYHEYQQFLKTNNIDILLTPTVAHLTPKIGHFDMNLDFDTLFERMVDWTSFTPYANANGSPSISLPIGHDEEKDLPIGMQFAANHGEEKLLFELSYQIEEAKPWKRIYG